MKPDILPAQLRAARALVNLDCNQVAEATGLAVRTLYRIENGQSKPRSSTLAAIRATLEAAGVEFINDVTPGVRLRFHPTG